MKCKGCGAELPFDAYGRMKCEYCGAQNYVPIPGKGIESKKELIRDEIQKPVKESGSKSGFPKGIVVLLILFFVVFSVYLIFNSNGDIPPITDSYPPPTTLHTTRTSSPTYKPSRTSSTTTTAPPTHIPLLTSSATTTVPPTTSAPTSTPHPTATPTPKELTNVEFGSVIRITDFSDDDDRSNDQKAVISGDGSKVLFVAHEPRPDGNGGWWNLFTVPTDGSMQETKIFNIEKSYKGLFYQTGSVSSVPALSHDGRYAYFLAIKKEKTSNSNGVFYKDLQWELGKLDTATDTFTALSLSAAGYPRIDPDAFRISGNKVYLIANMYEPDGFVRYGDFAQARGIFRMDLDGSNMELLWKHISKVENEQYPYGNGNIFIDEVNNRLFFDTFGGYRYLDLNTNNVVKLGENGQTGEIKAIVEGELIYAVSGAGYVYNVDTDTMSERIENGIMPMRGAKNGLVYFGGDGRFSIANVEGIKKDIITEESKATVGIYEWEGHGQSFSGDVVSLDGKTILVKDIWYELFWTKEVEGPLNFHVIRLK